MSIIENSGAIEIKETDIYFSFKYYHSLETTNIGRSLDIEDTITRRYSRFNATGTQLRVRLLTPVTPEFLSEIF